MKKTLMALIAIIALSVGNLAMPMVAGAAAIDDIKNSVGQADPGAPSVDSAYGAAITIFSTLIGLVSVIMILLGGYKYITSSGDANKAAAAKSTILYALIGVVLVVLAQTILKFTIAKTTNR